MLAGGCLCMWSCQLHWQLWAVYCEHICKTHLVMNTMKMRTISIFSCQIQTCFSSSVCLHRYVDDVWNLLTGSDHLLPHMHNLQLCSIPHTIIFKLLILSINALLLLMSLSLISFSKLSFSEISLTQTIIQHFVQRYYVVLYTIWTRDMNWGMSGNRNPVISVIICSLKMGR